MSEFIQALRRAEQARQRHRQELQQHEPSAQAEPPATPTPSHVDVDPPLLDLASAVRLGRRE